MNEGWVKIHRKLLKWEWFDNPQMLQLFLFMLLEANTEEKRWHGLTIRRGQFVTSAAKISAATGLTARQIRTCVKHLVETGEIIYDTTTGSTHRCVIVTVCEYCKYQENKPGSDKPATGCRQDSDEASTELRQDGNTTPTELRQDGNRPLTELRQDSDKIATGQRQQLKNNKKEENKENEKNERKREGERDVAPSPEDKGLFDFSQENVRDLMRFMSFADDS